MEWHESLALGMARGDAIGLADHVETLRDIIDQKNITIGAEAALTRSMVFETEDVIEGRRQGPFFTLKVNKDARNLFRDKYKDHCKRADVTPTDAEINTFRLQIENEYLNNNSSQLRLSTMMKDGTAPGMSGNKPTISAADAALLAELEKVQHVASERDGQYLGELAVTSAMVDEAEEVLKGNKHAAHFSTDKDARVALRRRIKGMSAYLRSLAQDQRYQIMEQTIEEVRAETKPKP